MGSRSRKVHEEINRGTFWNPRKYVIYDDRIEIQSPLKFYWFRIPYADVEKIEMRNPPVVWDAYKQRILFTANTFSEFIKMT